LSENLDKLCQKVKVNLETDRLEEHKEKEGEYQISTLVNGWPSWTSRSQSIWYIPQLKKWGIGPLDSLGSVMVGIWNELESVSEWPYEIKDWEYLSSTVTQQSQVNGWQPETVNEITVECIDRNFRE
jgi:hypothetical protein